MALNDSSKKKSPSPTWHGDDPITTQAAKRLDRSHSHDTGKDFPSHLSPTESLFPQLEDPTYCRNEPTDTRSEMSSRLPLHAIGTSTSDLSYELMDFEEDFSVSGS
ncbi:hypothetical protein K440DRAFT_633995 [Wilcoxina mikolae CBS 423.85]|nr:hypothetical protein K440DRAFT_633995 [Wilcoxina mikolae CBS 423.85]